MSEKIPNYNYDADEVLNDFKSKFAWPKRDEVQAVVKPGKMPLRLLLCALITAVVGGIAYYMMLPALNVHDTQLYLFLILLVVVFAGSFFLVCRANKKAERLEYVKKKDLDTGGHCGGDRCGDAGGFPGRCHHLPCFRLQRSNDGAEQRL